MEAEWFAGRLKELREGLGLTQPQLAERAKMNRFGIAKLEQGVTKPSWETVVALCKALGVECNSFMQPPEEREPTGRGRPPTGKDESPTPKQPRASQRKGKRK
jgi:transcriptional regulator with XRE-family HTH domain